MRSTALDGKDIRMAKILEHQNIRVCGKNSIPLITSVRGAVKWRFPRGAIPIGTSHAPT